MRILKFVKVDALKIKSFYLALLFPLLSAFMLVMSDEPDVLFGVSYCLFAGIVFSAFPFTGEKAEENGFQMMLPSKPGEEIYGHFVFGILALVCSLVLGFVSVGIAGIFNKAVLTAQIDVGAILAAFGAALIFVGIEDLLLTVFRYENIKALQFIRIIPAFIYFFGMNAAIKTDAPVSKVIMMPLKTGLLFFLVCVVIYAVFAVISARIVIKRGF